MRAKKCNMGVSSESNGIKQRKNEKSWCTSSSGLFYNFFDKSCFSLSWNYSYNFIKPTFPTVWYHFHFIFQASENQPRCWKCLMNIQHNQCETVSTQYLMLIYNVYSSVKYRNFVEITMWIIYFIQSIDTFESVGDTDTVIGI